jgi:hypothetical protein
MELQSHILEALPEEERAHFLDSMELIADACAAATEHAPQKGPQRR